MMKETDVCDSITLFNDGEDALAGLMEMYLINHGLPQIIFLNLNMPNMNGWEFLDRFIKLPNESLNISVIYVIRSTVDPRGIDKAKEHNLISNYILKPITQNNFEAVLESSTT